MVVPADIRFCAIAPRARLPRALPHLTKTGLQVNLVNGVSVVR